MSVWPDVFVYLAGPMTAKGGHTIEDNVAAGLRGFLACVAAGVPAYCPQLSGAFPTAWTVATWEQWLALDLAIIDRCTDVVMLPRWESSDGARKERAYAIDRGIRVHDSVAALIAYLEARGAEAIATL